MSSLLENLKQFLGSKKVKALILGLVALICSDLVKLDPETTDSIVKLFGLYLVGQGAADFGKGKAEAENPKLPVMD